MDDYNGIMQNHDTLLYILQHITIQEDKTAFLKYYFPPEDGNSVYYLSFMGYLRYLKTGVGIGLDIIEEIYNVLISASTIRLASLVAGTAVVLSRNNTEAEKWKKEIETLLFSIEEYQKGSKEKFLLYQQKKDVAPNYNSKISNEKLENELLQALNIILDFKATYNF